MNRTLLSTVGRLESAPVHSRRYVQRHTLSQALDNEHVLVLDQLGRFLQPWRVLRGHCVATDDFLPLGALLLVLEPLDQDLLHVVV